MSLSIRKSKNIPKRLIWIRKTSRVADLRAYSLAEYLLFSVNINILSPGDLMKKTTNYKILCLTLNVGLFYLSLVLTSVLNLHYPWSWVFLPVFTLVTSIILLRIFKVANKEMILVVIVEILIMITILYFAISKLLNSFL
jgi:hypothetical protein